MQRKKLLALPIDKARADIPVMQAIEEEKTVHISGQDLITLTTPLCTSQQVRRC